ncbi:MAG: hypothetical protein HOP28_04640 [Gemmatimonadales bacterium]|nr:hypothetical protein [Gemmatimonadales bacterium]
MKYQARLTALIVLGAAAITGGLAAQVRGLPVRNAGVGTGIGVAVDVGFPNADAGKGMTLGATGAIGLGPLGLTATAARFDPKGEGKAINSLGATANLKIFGGPLIPFSITAQGGIARSSYDVMTPGAIDPTGFTETHLPVGIGLALTIPNPVFSIKPWLAPRLDFVRTQFDGADAETDSRFAISGGVDLGFLNGFQVRVMYDRMKRGDVTPGILSLGLGLKVGT